MDKAALLEQLKEKTASAELPLKEQAIQIVFGKGSHDAPILFIGEAPGAKEDEQGIPFVGRAGQQLDGFLQSIGLGLNDVYIANILKYRPPKNRDPKPDEIAAHTPFLIEQIDIIQPAVIATLGNFSTKFVLGGFSKAGMKSVPGITQLHGRVQTVEREGKTYHVVPLYHPAAMLYRPALKETLEKDFKKMGEYLLTVLDGSVKDKIATGLASQPGGVQQTLF